MDWRESAALHAAAEYPRESCGVVVSGAGPLAYWPCENVAEQTGEFSVDPHALAAVEDIGLEVVGIVHSHPDENTPRPSQADVQACDAGDTPWHVIGWPSGRWVDFLPAAQVPPLGERVFAHGVLDCWSLVRDWFRLERGIVLPDFARDDEWWNRGGNLYLEGFPSAGFVEHDGPLQVGDVVLLRIGSRVPNHAGVYVDGDRIFHHLAGRLSTREPFDGFLRERLTHVLRYSP